MSAQDFLVELGTEELPPKALATLGDAFLAGIEKGLQAAGLNYTGKQVYAAPRRLAVLIRQLDVQQPDRSINIDGPPLQAPSCASPSISRARPPPACCRPSSKIRSTTCRSPSACAGPPAVKSSCARPSGW
jgi:glycyl-tRNA synthetase beta subunit